MNPQSVLDQVTVTVRRGEHDLTVALFPTRDGWEVLCALDEDSDDVVLTDAETAEAVRLADDGVDETGRDE
ncbi:MAG: hypothetical protein EBZ91_10175 [Gammaproteobacteria bacterium]|nr:hypothetical protein [Gammaproteobacteria bacterium]